MKIITDSIEDMNSEQLKELIQSLNLKTTNYSKEAANAGLTRAISIFEGPIGWVLTGIWTLIDIGGPASRVTISSVIHISYMRLKVESETEERNFNKMSNGSVSTPIKTYDLGKCKSISWNCE